MIDDIQVKLERKSYENAKQYYKLERYKAAVVAFESFADNFPDSDYNEEGQYLKFLSQYLLAENSIASKQLERYRLANEYYIELLDRYPNSEYLKEAEKKYGNSIDRVNQLAKNN